MIANKCKKICLDKHIAFDLRREIANKDWLIYGDDEGNRKYNILCSNLDRICDIVEYLNEKELDSGKYRSCAFDFIEFITQSAVMIECIKEVSVALTGCDLSMKEHEPFFKHIVFSKKYKNESFTVQRCDKEYFSYIRSLTSIHPGTTDCHHFFQQFDMETSPFIIWTSNTGIGFGDGADLYVRVYEKGSSAEIKNVLIYLKEVFDYIEWVYGCLNDLNKPLSRITKSRIKQYKKEKIPNLKDYKNYSDFLLALKDETEKRIGYKESDIEQAACIINAKLSGENKDKLEMYKKELVKAIDDFCVKLQKMDFKAINNNDLLLSKMVNHRVDDQKMIVGSHYYYSKIQYLAFSELDDEPGRFGARCLVPFLKKYINIDGDMCNSMDRYDLYALVCTGFYIYEKTKK